MPLGDGAHQCSTDLPAAGRYRARLTSVVVRREYLLRGVVQGVGFRPHVAQVASRHPVSGFCGNDDAQVFLEVQGEPAAVDAFWDELVATLPPLATIISTSVRMLAPTPATGTGFAIVASRRGGGARTLIPPDVATCTDCLAEMADPANRRHRYAFITCTNCGPRLSIIQDLPYDRPATTMKAFPMCVRCRREYADPADRRYHAQPISCYSCGPRLWLADPRDPAQATGVRPGPAPAGPPDQAAVIAEGARRLRAGAILAVKGIGGFHLLCDARNPAAVGTLRTRKRRSQKPFAVMVPDPAAATGLARLSVAQLRLLESVARPIVIAPMTGGYDLADAVAPGLADVGVLLPYAPVHTLLLEETAMALVATSGNLSDEPLCHTNTDACSRLAGLADAVLLHDRDIHVPVEDSVHLALPAGGSIPVRRSRGYAPLPVSLAPGPTVLATGGEIKNTFALAIGDQAMISAHVGDMGSLAAQRAFEASVSQLLRIHRAEPEIVVCDLHPGYATTAWAERYAEAHGGVSLRPVQHHLAHALSLLAEQTRHDLTAVVATLDGTGYGTDATIWGGEVLRLHLDGTVLDWSRVGHVPTFPLAGGDRAIRHPWRVALGLAYAWGIDLGPTEALADAPTVELELVRSQLSSGTGVVQTSSMGRLFDAAAAVLGLCPRPSYEAQAAMELERAALSWRPASTAATTPADFAEVFDELLRTPQRPLPERAWRFHRGLAYAVATMLIEEAERAGTTTVGLSGGVALNRLFAAAVAEHLARVGLTLLTHHLVPPNDGGLSLGQAWAGRLAITESADPR